MIYRERAPAESLLSTIECVWTLEGHARDLRRAELAGFFTGRGR